MKNFILIFLIIIIYIFIGGKVENVTIPDEAIRFRIIANSDSKEDQKLKMDIALKVEEKLYTLLKDTKGIGDARKIITENLYEIENIVKGFTNNYNINYGNNYFPSKEHKGIKYDAGNYESLLITLGAASGKNWWCVLFPPLCLMEANESETYEYKLFVKEIFDKYL